MNRTASAVFVAVVLAATSVLAAENTATEQENSLLMLVLKRSYRDGGYTVVSPEARLSHMGGRGAREIEKSKKYIIEHLRTKGVEVARLVDRLFERNKKAVRLSIKSSPEDGYVIDDGKYAKYFEKDGGGWDRWYEENPKAHGSTTVSLPVYDEKTGPVLVYTGTQTHWLAGSGWVILYRYEKGELKEVGKVILWVS